MTSNDENDEPLFQQMRHELFVAAVGDILDTLGYHHQFLPPGIMPLDKHMRIVGRAMPVRRHQAQRPWPRTTKTVVLWHG